MSARIWMSVLLGFASALAGAVGIALLMLWVLDAGGPERSIAALAGGIAALLITTALVAGRRRLRSVTQGADDSSELAE